MASAPNHASGTASTVWRRLFGDDGFTFGDVLDLVNPLQHIPVVSSYYRKWTGDDIAPAIRLVGGGLLGGPLGAGLAVAGLAVEAGVRTHFKTPATAPPSELGMGAPALAAPTRHAPGGWLVAATRTGGVAAVPDEAGSASGAANAVATHPGGWMVAETRRVAAERSDRQPVVSAAARERPRPGGWMVAAAYAAADTAAQARTLTTRA